MFDVGFSELFLIAIVAIIAIGPEDLPDALFRVGRFTRQVKMFLGGIRDQYSEIMHEAELAHYRKKLEQDVLGEPDAIAITEPKKEEINAEKPANPDA